MAARTGRPRAKRKPGPGSDVRPASPSGDAGEDLGADGRADARPVPAGADVPAAPDVVPPFRRGTRLGVDVGSVRVGLAASDPDGVLATAVETLARERPTSARGRRGGTTVPPRDGAGVPEDVRRVAEEVSRRGAVEVVVGLPRSLSGDEGRAASLAREYARRLAVVVAPVPVRLVDERLSTAGAHRALYEGGTSGKKHRAVVDQVAAAWILQTALDLERASGRPPGSLVVPAGAGAAAAAAAQDLSGEEHATHDPPRRREHEHDDDDGVGGPVGVRSTDDQTRERAAGPPAEEDATVSSPASEPGDRAPRVPLPGPARARRPRPGDGG